MGHWSTNLNCRNNLDGKESEKIDKDVGEKRKDSGSLKSITADDI